MRLPIHAALSSEIGTSPASFPLPSCSASTDIGSQEAAGSLSGLFRGRDVAVNRLGIRRDDLAKMVRDGLLKAPVKRDGTRYLWTEADIREVEKVLQD